MTEPASPPTPKRRRRRIWLVPLTVVAMVAALAALGWSYRTLVAENIARQALDAAGLGVEIDFHVASLDGGHIRLEDISVGEDGPRARAAEVDFALGDVMSGKVRSIRLIEPELTLAETEDGRVAVAGLPPDFASAGETDAVGSATFPQLPDIAQIEIDNGQIRIETQDASAVGVLDATVARRADGGFAGALSLALADPNGRQATIVAKDVAIDYAADAIVGKGPISVFVADVMADGVANVELWLEGEAKPTGALAAALLVVNGSGAFGEDVSFGGATGRIVFDQGVEGPAKTEVDLNFRKLKGPSTSLAFAALSASLEGHACEMLFDAIGPSGYLAVDLLAPEGIGPVSVSVNGEIDGEAISALIPPLDAKGRTRFDINVEIALASLMIDPDARYVTGEAELILEMPELAIEGFAKNGTAFGQLDLAISGGAVTVTSPGVAVGGVSLPDALLATLPLDVRRAFSDPAFVRFGGPGLATTAITLSQRESGRLSAVGTIGLGVSNPNLAIFVEGDAAIGASPDGQIEFVESELLNVRVVDAAFGPATVGGSIELTNLSGSRTSYTADAKVEAQAKVVDGGFVVENAEIDFAGPLEITSARAILEPKAGGGILLSGYSGPQFSAPGPLKLTLTDRGARSIVYDRTQDTIDAALNFRGFKTVAFLNSEDGKSGEVDLTLGGFGAAVSQEGVVLTLDGASARIPAFDIALDGADGRIAFGGEETQTGRLTIEQIRHLGDPPLIRPLSLRMDVAGKGDQLNFEGRLIAAGGRARLNVAGRHNLATGEGGADIELPPIVFAPGVLQPQDFIPPLFRVLLETVGEIGAEAAVAWNTDGLTQERGRIDVAIDKLRTSEITIDQMTGSFELDGLAPPSTDGPQRLRIGALDVGVPLTSGALEIDVLSPEKIEVRIDEFGLFGGLIKSKVIEIDPTKQTFRTTLEVSGIDLSSILAFAEFGELSATGALEGVLPFTYANGEIKIDDGLIKTASGGGELRYRPKAIDTALSEVDRSSELALKAISHFAYDEISIRINEIAGEELRLDIFIGGRSLDLFEGVPFEFNIAIEGPIRQIIQDSLSPVDLPAEVQELIDQGQVVVDQPDPEKAPAFPPSDIEPAD